LDRATVYSFGEASSTVQSWTSQDSGHIPKALGAWQEAELMRVLLADDQAQVRWALRTVVGEQPGLTLVGEVSEANSLLRQAQVLQPDLILLDEALPGQPLDAMLDALRRSGSSPTVVVLGLRPGSESTALAAGADLFVSKSAQPEQLLCLLRSFARKESFIDCKS